ncbi:hypothetical protein RB195_023061 [Necator americanus]|uniref:Integrase catalytic domain-containing protein n=1 Tax=Necator americanus TaxID=51031 RepID=A0ABR1EHW8_NECAM
MIVSDNGTQFTAKEFQEFCDQQGFEHVPSSPFHSQTCYRRTPCASTPRRPSPAEVFLVRTSLTLQKESAKEEGTCNVEMEEQFNRHHEARKRSYHKEKLVWVRGYSPGHEKWIPARVKNRHERAVYDERRFVEKKCEPDAWRKAAES